MGKVRSTPTPRTPYDIQGQWGAGAMRGKRYIWAPRISKIPRKWLVPGPGRPDLEYGDMICRFPCSHAPMLPCFHASTLPRFQHTWQTRGFLSQALVHLAFHFRYQITPSKLVNLMVKFRNLGNVKDSSLYMLRQCPTLVSRRCHPTPSRRVSLPFAIKTHWRRSFTPVPPVHGFQVRGRQ